MSLDQQIEAFFSPVAEKLSTLVFYHWHFMGHDVPLIVLWFAIAACLFTVYFGFINLRGFTRALDIIRGKTRHGGGSGEISHFQALSTAISGTVGVGNIGGVAVAIGVGGPGAAFWLVVAGFLAMSTKFVECTLGVKYRKLNTDGSVSGGPMHYLEHYFVSRNRPLIGKSLGGFYALALVIGCLGIGNMFQSNQAYAQIVNITGGTDSLFAERGWLFGVLLALVVGAVIIGGIRSIARVAAKLVPFMAIIYCVSATFIIAFSAEHLLGAIKLIFTSAFSFDSVQGGMIGAIIIGFQRALFSNEAGIGSASIAHSAVKTNEPISEGLVSLLEPFIDTIVICTITSLVIVTTAYPNGLMESHLGHEGIELTSAAFAHHISWSPILLGIAALLFAFSTAIAWSYYGLKAWSYLVGESAASQLFFKGLFCSFIVLGCTVELSSILNFSDSMVYLIAVPNIIGLYLYAPEIKKDLADYLQSY